ncbi:hypothetical protein M3202_18485 [Alkalihalobacillus oceani]|uniref:Uncharacterized protein n=1 Tax=Halalkalibacter oceani TaxID=1653776 RepID=A0A9X2DTC1_9BACI|nr:hypothetical protein [Halalkalibacter oceani]MCM3716043.1 hypothetical protein [Halalkalibacter oceani]
MNEIIKSNKEEPGIDFEDLFETDIVKEFKFEELESELRVVMEELNRQHLLNLYFYKRYDELLKLIGDRHTVLSSSLRKEYDFKISYQPSEKTTTLKTKHVLPTLKKVMPNKVYREYRTHFIKLIAPGLTKIQQEFGIHYEKAMVIFFYVSNTKEIDVDNRFQSFVFDAIRNARLIQNDNLTHLSTLSYGQYSDKPESTTITIIEERTFAEWVASQSNFFCRNNVSS